MSDQSRVPLSDARLFDFNAALLSDYDDAKAHAELDQYGDAFRFQLVAALHLDAWAERLQEPTAPARQSMDELEIRGWVNALHDVAGRLRQGHYLPGGPDFNGVVGES